ncbi:MAG: rhodanese-like domain-containing protein [bacterium]|nr:rhodanese-like domain-containing protein [bacterium]MDY4099897.1 rhodanese-like domain-containing protein [Lachnospiraceae bacterium]
MRYQLLSKDEFLHAMRRENTLLIDLRDPGSFARWHLPGAVNRSYDAIRDWSAELDRSQKILLYCSHGNESILAARYLGSRGFQVYSLIGGVGNRR